MSNAKKFSANGTDVDVQKFLNNVDSNTESYISQMNWGAKRANAFRQSLNQYKSAISSGNIAQRDAKNQYVDNTGALKNQEEKFKGTLGIDFLRKDRDINGDVASFLDTQLNPMVTTKLNTPKQDFNPNFTQYFNAQAFGNNSTPDWDAWSSGENYLGKGKTKVLDTSKRVSAFKKILTNYKNKIKQDDSDYNWGNFGDKNQFLKRIDTALTGLDNGLSKDDYATLSSLGITSDVIKNNLFNTTVNKVTPTVAVDSVKNTDKTTGKTTGKTTIESIQDQDDINQQKAIIAGFINFRKDLQRKGWGHVNNPITGIASNYTGAIPSAQALAKQMQEGSQNIDLNRSSIANAAALYFSKYANQEPNAYLGVNAQGQKEYIVPYTPNKNGTFVVYNSSTGSIKQVPISNYIKYNDTKNPKYSWLAKYIYRHENGGTIKHQDGGTLASLKAKLHSYDSLEEIRRIHPQDLPAGFTYDPTTRNTLQQQIQQETTKAQTTKPVEDSKYDFFSPTIKNTLSNPRGLQNIAEAVSLGSSFFPGTGTVISAGAGILGAGAGLWGDLKEGVPAGTATLNFGKNLGMGVLGAIPGMKFAKYTKFLKASKNAKEAEEAAALLSKAKEAKNIGKASAVSFGSILGLNTVNDVAKVADNPTKSNWENLGYSALQDILFAKGIRNLHKVNKLQGTETNPKPGSELGTGTPPKGGTTGGTSVKDGSTTGTPNGTVPEGTTKPPIITYDKDGNPKIPEAVILEETPELVQTPTPEPVTEPVTPKPVTEPVTPTTEQSTKPSTLQNVVNFVKKHKVATTIGATTAALSALNSARAQTPTRPQLTDISFYGSPTNEDFGNQVNNTDVGRFNFNPKTGEVNLYDPAGNRTWKNNGVQHTLMLPEVSVTKPKKAKPINKHKEGGILKYLKGSSVTAGAGPNPKTTLLNFDKISSTYNKIFPDVSAAIRTIGDINTNNTVKNQMLEGMHATLYNPFSIHHSIYGDLGTKQGYYQRAAEMEYQPQPITSDANLQLASNLERKNNADKYRFQGDLENNKAITGNTELASKYNMQNSQMQNEIANKNMQSMNATNQARTQLKAQTTAANRQSIDTYLEQQEYRKQATNDKVQDLQGNNMQDWLQFKYYNDSKSQAYQQALTNWLSIKGNTDITKWDQYKPYMNYTQKQSAGYRNEMNDYLKQVYPGYNPLKFTTNENSY